MERAVAAALGHRAAAVLAATPERGLELVEHARSAGLGNLVVLVGRDPKELVAELSVVPIDELLQSPVPAVTQEGVGYDPERGELWFVGEAAEAIQLELEAQFRLLQVQARELGTRAAAAEPRVRHTDPRLIGLAERLEAELGRCIEAGRRREAPLEAETRTESSRAGELAAELRRLGALEADLRHESSSVGERASSVDVELARLEAEAAEARRRLVGGERRAGRGPARGAVIEARAARAPARAPRRRQPVREGGVRA